MSECVWLCGSGEDREQRVTWWHVDRPVWCYAALAVGRRSSLCTRMYRMVLTTRTHVHNRFTALWILSGTSRVSRYQKKHSPTYTYHGHQSSLICFIHLLLSMASSLFSTRTWQSFSAISLQVFFGLPLGLAPSTSYSIHFFTQSLSSFRNTCRYHCNLFYCSTEIMSSNPCLSTLYFTPHIHLTTLISARNSHFHVTCLVPPGDTN